MPARDYAMLQRYWMHEPWGPWRDNLHTAILARETLRPHFKKGSSIRLDDFMLRHPDEVAEETAARRKAATRGLFGILKSVATRKSKPQ